MAQSRSKSQLDSNNPTYKDNMSAFALHHGTAADSERWDDIYSSLPNTSVRLDSVEDEVKAYTLNCSM